VRHRSLAALLAVCLVAAAPAALAFNYRFLRTSVLKQLTPEDIEIGTRVTREALDSGTDGEWTNPATGATGTIRILGTVDLAGHQGCRRTRLDVTARGRSGGGEFTLCRTPSGTWNFHNPPR
jgi:surface antigen